jgi:flagellar biosynthetic protein FlhB
MSEDMGDRTEDATPRKIEEAREKGRVVRSADLSSALVLLGGLLVLKIWGANVLDAMFQFTSAALGNLGARDMTVDDIYAYFGAGGLFLLKAMLPVIGGLVFIAFIGNVAQTGFVFSSEPLLFKFERVNPIEGMRRLMSKRGFVRLLGSIFKVIVVGAIAYFTIRGQFGAYLDLADASFYEIVSFTLGCAYEIALKIALALLALAILDFAYQRWQYMQDLRMTKQEVREELKRMEGDPLTRDRRRRVARQVAMHRMMHNVPRADVVVTNPTEIAVALRYEAGVMNAPTVLAKGKGLLAQRIREIATEHEIPIVERKPLAQSLYKLCEIGDQVPVSLYQAVAEVLAFVYELNRMKRRERVAVAT